MNQVYWAAFDTGAMPPRPLTPESLADPDAVELPGDSRYYGAGHGFAAYPALVARLGDRLVGVDGQALPRAGDIARIGAAQLEAGEGVPAARGLPVYLRDDVVHRR
jgi:tRNA threonylcarbamoyladenosine biosynthesis protein TsaB